MNNAIKEMLEATSNKAVEHVAVNRAYHAQLASIDKKTKLLCLRFITATKIEPAERELFIADLVRLQATRNELVQEVLNHNIL